MNSLTTIRTTNRMLGTIAPRLTADVARRMLMTPHNHAPREWELPALASAERITLRFGLAGLRWGTSGPIVLLQHGWDGRPTQFTHLIRPLLDAGRQVIALEAPGHGRSPGDESHVHAFAQAILEAIAEIKGIESVVGHSMGGSALLYALTQERFAERAVVIGSPASLARVLDRFADTLALPEPAKRAFLELIDARTGMPARDMDAAKFGPQLGVPGLIVHDRDDDSVPFAEGEALAKHWPQSRFIATRGLGHRKVLGDPGVVTAITDFLVPERHGLRAA